MCLQAQLTAAVSCHVERPQAEWKVQGRESASAQWLAWVPLSPNIQRALCTHIAAPWPRPPLPWPVPAHAASQGQLGPRAPPALSAFGPGHVVQAWAPAQKRRVSTHLARLVLTLGSGRGGHAACRAGGHKGAFHTPSRGHGSCSLVQLWAPPSPLQPTNVRCSGRGSLATAAAYRVPRLIRGPEASPPHAQSILYPIRAQC